MSAEEVAYKPDYGYDPALDTVKKIDVDLLELIITNGLRVVGTTNEAAGGGNAILYTCPENKTCFMFMVFLAGDNAGAASDLVVMRINNENWLILNVDNNDIANGTYNFPFPLKLSGSETLNITSGLNTSVTGGFLGYELDNEFFFKRQI